VAHQSNIDKDIKNYFITFDNDLTVYDIDNGRLTITVDNKPAGSHGLDIYGLSRSSTILQAKISASDLSDQAGTAIESQQIVFEPTVIQLRASSTSPDKVSLSIENSTEAGTFHGRIFLLVGQSLTSVPIKASTGPLFEIAILWVLVGIAAALAFWEIIRYLEKLKLTKQRDVVMKEIANSRKNYKQLIAKGTNAETIEDWIQSDMIAAANIETKVSSSEARLEDMKQRLRILLIQIASTAVPTAIAVIALFNDPFVSNLQTRGELDRWILIGIGFGIGSANKLVDRG
jgi:hypothetical protein